MKINTYLKTISIIVAIICLMTSTPFASKGDPQSDIKHTLKTNDKLEIGTILHFSFGVTPMQLTCDEIDVSVETVGSITYFGQTFWSVPYKDREETLYSFDIQLQADDTCGLLINLSCGDFTTTINRHFITTSDSVEMIIGRLPTFSNEYIRPDYEGRIGNVIPGEFPEDDSLYGIPTTPFIPSPLVAATMSTWPIDFQIETEDEIDINQPIEFALDFFLNSPPCDMIEIFIEGFDGLYFFGETYWTASVDDLNNSIKTIDIIIPDKDTSRIEITLICDSHYYTIIREFIVTDEIIEMRRGILHGGSDGIMTPLY